VSSALVSKPGKPPGLCSAGLLDVCTARRMWPNGPGGFPGLDTEAELTIVLLMGAYWCPKHVESINQHIGHM
jgi:hypothetical protein